MKQDLVFKGENGQALTTSLLVAEKFEKNHRDVLDAIRELIKGCAENSAAPCFEETTYTHHQNGQVYPMFIMNRDGFSLLAMGFTGKKALEFKLGFISAFNKMENAIRTGGFEIPQSFSEALMLAANQAKQIEQLEQSNEQKDKAITKLQPKADFADAAFSSDTLISISQAAKILRLGFGRNTLFKKLREAGVFFANRNEPKQRFVNAKYFNLVEGKPIPRSDGSIIIPVTVYCTQKGLAYINHLFGSKRSETQLATIR